MTHRAVLLGIATLLAAPAWPALAQDRAAEASTEAPELDLGDGAALETLLLEREIPLVGGGWGLDLFLDIPLNNEPSNAEITLRRAKLNYARRLPWDLSFKITGDYTRGGGLEFSDSYLSWTGWKGYRLRVGITDPPFSLESVSSSSGLTFMERALPVFALSERKSGGINLLRRDRRQILNATLVLFNIDRDDLREEGQGLVFHYAWSPLTDGVDHGLHLGASASYRWNAKESGTQFRSRPEVATINDYWIDTGQIADADKVGRLSLEASHVLGRFSWQAEVLGTRVERTGSPDLEFHGAYLFASWFLTDDSRVYDPVDGSYSWVRVNSPLGHGGRGAFELAARVSRADLTDLDVVGGTETNLTLGFNWYANNQWRVMTNLIKVLDVDRPGSEFDGLDPLIFSMRLQWVLR